MMLPKHFLSAGALSLLMAAPAVAEEHVVILTGFSYFPSVTYAQPGDTVRFVNQSGDEETVVGRDVGWVVGPLQDQDEGTLVVNEETELAFFSAYTACDDSSCSGDSTDPFDDDNYGSYEEAPIKAEITFEAPVLEEELSNS